MGSAAKLSVALRRRTSSDNGFSLRMRRVVKHQSRCSRAGSREESEYAPAPISSNANAINNCVSAYSIPPFETSKPWKMHQENRSQHHNDQSHSRESDKDTQQHGHCGHNL